MKKELTTEELHEIFEYRDDGNLYWKVSSGRRKKIGDMAGCRGIDTRSGNPRYVVIYKKKSRQAPRLIFQMFHGYIPKSVICLDKDSSNTRIENLKEATNSQMQYNKRKMSSNTSGYRGVSFSKSKKKWSASICMNGKQISLGAFDDPQKAHAAYCRAADILHDEFANHG